MGTIYQNYRQLLFFYIFLCTIDIYIIFREDEEDAPSQIFHLIGNLPHRDAQAYQHLLKGFLCLSYYLLHSQKIQNFRKCTKNTFII